MSCCCCINNCFKILLWMFSVLIFFLGCALIVIPLVIFYDQSFTSVEDFVEQYIPVSDLEIFTWVIVGIGALTLIISFLGCGAAHSNHKCVKIAFFIVNGIVAAGLGVIAGFVFSKTPDLSTNLGNALGNYTLIYYGENGDAGNTVESNFVDEFENKYTCCGIFTPGKNPDKGEPDAAPQCFGWNNNIPIGCDCDPLTDGDECVSPYQECDTESAGIWKDGCFDAIENQAMTFLNGLGGIAVVGAVICAIAALLCCWLCCCDEIL